MADNTAEQARLLGKRLRYGQTVQVGSRCHIFSILQLKPVEMGSLSRYFFHLGVYDKAISPFPEFLF